MIFLTNYYGASLFAIHLERTLGGTLVVSAISIAVMVVTLFKIPKVSSNNSVTSEDVQSPRKMEKTPTLLTLNLSSGDC